MLGLGLKVEAKDRVRVKVWVKVKVRVRVHGKARHDKTRRETNIPSFELQFKATVAGTYHQRTIYMIRCDLRHET